MPSNLDVGAPIPAAIGRVADLYMEVKTVRLAMEKECEAVKARESELKQHMIDNLSKSDDTGAAGLKYRAQVVTKPTPRVADWPIFHDYIQRTGRFDLLQKRVGDVAVKAMWEEGELVPGVEKFNAVDVSVTKI